MKANDDSFGCLHSLPSAYAQNFTCLERALVLVDPPSVTGIPQQVSVNKPLSSALGGAKVVCSDLLVFEACQLRPGPAENCIVYNCT